MAAQLAQVGAGAKVNVEYVSANPTGPLHVAHARGAVVGDALANLLAKAGFAVAMDREFSKSAEAGKRVPVESGAAVSHGVAHGMLSFG